MYEFRFQQLKTEFLGPFKVYREIVTDCLYIQSDTTNYGGLTAMMNPKTGRPLTYEEWKIFQSSYENK